MQPQPQPRNSVALSPDLAGYTASQWIDRPGTAGWWGSSAWCAEVTHAATGTSARVMSPRAPDALAAALRLCRARVAMAARAEHPPRLVRDVDATAPDGAAMLAAMDAGDLGAGAAR